MCILEVLHLSPPSARIGLLVIMVAEFFFHQKSFELKGRQGDVLVTVLVESYWNSLHCGDRKSVV